MSFLFIQKWFEHIFYKFNFNEEKSRIANRRQDFKKAIKTFDWLKAVNVLILSSRRVSAGLAFQLFFCSTPKTKERLHKLRFL